MNAVELRDENRALKAMVEKNGTSMEGAGEGSHERDLRQWITGYQF